MTANANVVKRITLALAILLVLIQFVPVSTANPPVTREVRWNSPSTRALAQRSCFDCHVQYAVGARLLLA